MSTPLAKRIDFKAALRLVGPLILVLVIVRLPDPYGLWVQLKRAYPPWLLSSLVITIVLIHFKVMRWQLILRARGIHYDTRRAWVAFGSALYLSALTPGRVGDALRIQYLRHDRGVRYAEGLASIVFDRLCDLYVLAAFVAIAIVHFGRTLGSDLRALGWATVASIALGPLLLLVPGLFERLFTAAYKRVAKSEESDGLRHFLSALRVQIGRLLLLTMPWTLVCFAVTCAQGYVCARALGMELAPFDVACLLAMASLIGLLPISISGLGVREALLATMFPKLGYSAQDGVAFGLVLFTVVYLASAVLGAFFWHFWPPPTGPVARDAI